MPSGDALVDCVLIPETPSLLVNSPFEVDCVEPVTVDVGGPGTSGAGAVGRGAMDDVVIGCVENVGAGGAAAFFAGDGGTTYEPSL